MFNSSLLLSPLRRAYTQSTVSRFQNWRTVYQIVRIALYHLTQLAKFRGIFLCCLSEESRYNWIVTESFVKNFERFMESSQYERMYVGTNAKMYRILELFNPRVWLFKGGYQTGIKPDLVLYIRVWLVQRNTQKNVPVASSKSNRPAEKSYIN